MARMTVESCRSRLLTASDDRYQAISPVSTTNSASVRAPRQPRRSTGNVLLWANHVQSWPSWSSRQSASDLHCGTIECSVWSTKVGGRIIERNRPGFPRVFLAPGSVTGEQATRLIYHRPRTSLPLTVLLHSHRTHRHVHHWSSHQVQGRRLLGRRRASQARGR